MNRLAATMLIGVASSIPLRAQIQNAAAPMWSPDGGRIAFASNRAGDWNLYVLTLKTAELHQITHHPSTDSNPAWSPDGKRIVFESDRDGDFELYSMAVETGEISQLTSFDATRDGRPQYAPDGRHIYFHSMRGPRPERYDTDIFIMSLDRPSLFRLVDGVGGDSYAAWSPAGNFLLFGSNRDGPWEIYRISSTGANRQKIVATEGDNAANFPSFSPDGSRFVHQLVTDDGSDLFVVDLTGGNGVNITATSGLYELHPAWSPDGRDIAFVIRIGESAGPGDLFLVSPDGSNRRPVPLSFPGASGH